MMHKLLSKVAVIGSVCIIALIDCKQNTNTTTNSNTQSTSFNLVEEKIYPSMGPDTFVLHDDKRMVSCWAVSYGSGVITMSCIPDWQLQSEPK